MDISKIIDFFSRVNTSDSLPYNLRDKEKLALISTLEEKVKLLGSSNEKVKEEVWLRLRKDINKERKIRIIKHFASWAAMIFIPLIVSIVIFKPVERIDEKTEKTLALKPGKSQAVLFLADGEEVKLEKTKEGSIKYSKELIISKDSNNTISYKKDAVVNKKGIRKEKYNRVIVPKAGEYKLVLADGTKVWLNSDTELKFPEIFYGKERRVYLKGEAYFEVYKDKKHPFKVIFNKGEVEVLGTAFSVTAYDEEREVKSVLKDGSVRFKGNTLTGIKSVVLCPHSKAVLNDSILVEEVDLRSELGWLEGKFYFEDMRLEDIIRKLERWYNFNVFYQNENLKDLLFTGVALKYKTLDDILKKIEMTTNVKFKISKSNTIIVQ